MTHAAPVSLTPGDELLPWASTDRQQRRPRQRDTPQVSGMETLLCCCPPPWRGGAGAGEDASAAGNMPQSLT